jgi:ABC-type polar amino acid transport system ATPase subunit
MAPGVTTLQVRDVDICRNGRLIVQGVSFSADRGERLAIMGPSGSGKTTILRGIAGLDPLASGTVHVGRVGLVFQFHHLFEHLSALHNVWLAPVHVLKQSRVEAERRAHELLDMLGVGARASALPHQLSGGEAQRVAIARALAMDPPVLLMDEPTASLDPARRGELAATLRQLAAQGRTVVLSTHDSDFVRSCADRVVMLEGGRVVRAGATRDVLS